MKRLIAWCLLGLVALSAAPAARAGDAIFGWVGTAEVRIPGQGVKVVTVKGVVTAPDVGTALAIGRLQARAQAEQYGDVVVGPTVNLVSPFAIPSIPVGPRRSAQSGGLAMITPAATLLLAGTLPGLLLDEAGGGCQICGAACPTCKNQCFNEKGHTGKHCCIFNNHSW
jgi:hypothetical protein